MKQVQVIGNLKNHSIKLEINFPITDNWEDIKTEVLLTLDQMLIQKIDVQYLQYDQNGKLLSIC
jgi:hypothetical protein